MLPAIGREQARRPPAQADGLAASVAGQPAQLHREHQDQQDADEESRQRHAQQRAGQQQLRQHAVALERGIHAQRHADHQRQHRRDQRQFQRGRQARLQQRGHGFALAQGDAEIALRGVGDEVAELDDGGLVQAQALTQLDAFGVGGVLAQHDGDGIADVLK